MRSQHAFRRVDRPADFTEYNVTLTSITRLGKGVVGHYIENDDVRNFAISRADEVAKRYGWRMPREQVS